MAKPPVAEKPDLLIQKGMPASPDCEAGVLGSILLDNHVYDLVSHLLRGEDFFHEANARIWNRMVALRSAGPSVSISFETLTEDLINRKELDVVGGVTYLSTLTDLLPRPTVAVEYAQIVAGLAERRRMIKAAHAIYEEGLDRSYVDGEENPTTAHSAYLDRSEAAILQVRSRTVTQANHVSAITPRLEMMLNGEGKPLGIPTGFDDLDHELACGGMPTGEVSIIAGESQHGKTSFMLPLAQRAAEQGNVTVIFSIETQDLRLLLRMCCQWAGVSVYKALHRKLSPWDRENIREAQRYLSALPLYIEDASQLNAIDIASRARRLKAKWIGVDYLQILQNPPGKRSGTRNDDIAETNRLFKATAKELDAVVILLSQLTKPENKKEGDGPPTLARLRDSGTIAEQAYNVLGVYRECKAGPGRVDMGTTQIHVLKNKDGETSMVELGFEAQYTRFSTVSKAPTGDQQRRLPK